MAKKRTALASCLSVVLVAVMLFLSVLIGFVNVALFTF
jgi:hypothetical protein